MHEIIARNGGFFWVGGGGGASSQPQLLVLSLAASLTASVFLSSKLQLLLQVLD